MKNLILSSDFKIFCSILTHFYVNHWEITRPQSLGDSSSPNAVCSDHTR